MHQAYVGQAARPTIGAVALQHAVHITRGAENATEVVWSARLDV